jgi:DNA invertase Pin-like site-specific DNA recombinase
MNAEWSIGQLIRSRPLRRISSMNGGAREAHETEDRPLALLGYLVTATDQSGPGASAESVAAELAEACTQRGWYLAEVVRDSRASGSERPGLAYALSQLSSGRADGLVVAELHDLAGTLGEMAPVLHWFSESGRVLVAIDVDLDSTAPGGARLVHALAVVGDREREGTVGPTQPKASPDHAL